MSDPTKKKWYSDTSKWWIRLMWWPLLLIIYPVLLAVVVCGAMAMILIFPAYDWSDT